MIKISRKVSVVLKWQITVEIMVQVIDILSAKYPGAIWLLVGGALVWAFFSIKNHMRLKSDKADNTHKATCRHGSFPCFKYGEKIDQMEKRAEDAHGNLINFPCLIHRTTTENQKKNESEMNPNVAEIKISITFAQKITDS